MGARLRAAALVGAVAAGAAWALLGGAGGDVLAAVGTVAGALLLTDAWRRRRAARAADRET